MNCTIPLVSLKYDFHLTLFLVLKSMNFTWKLSNGNWRNALARKHGTREEDNDDEELDDEDAVDSEDEEDEEEELDD